MVDSRLKNDPPTLFHCFLDIHPPDSNKDSKIELLYPEEFNEKEIILKQVPGFCYPCEIKSDGVEYSTFVLTDLDSKFRFGFCRYPSKAQRCLCIISYLPWFKTFYSVLDRVSQLFGNIQDEKKKDVCDFLEILNKELIPDPGSQMFMKFQDKTYSFVSPDTRRLPTIPDNRNLTKYYAKIVPENMVRLFVSMMFERRIIVTSSKLSVLTAVVHGSVSLLYPMQWQHIYVPILPPHLIDYCCAPMPFLLGIHASIMPKVRQMPMNEVVILNADTNEIEMPDDGLDDSFPKSVIAKLEKRLSRTERASKDYVSSLFLEALADLIGGYRDALKYVETTEGGRVVFDDEMFLTSRRANRKQFLESMLALQSFRQFIAGRLDMINDGVDFVDIFEKAIIKRNNDAAAETKFDTFKGRMKKGGGALKKSVGGKYSYLKGVASELEVKEEMKDIKKKLTEKMKKKKKEKELRKELEKEKMEGGNVKRNNSLPANSSVAYSIKRHQTISATRQSLYSSVPKKDVGSKPSKTPPPRPPRPTTLMVPPSVVDRSGEECRSVELPRRLLDVADMNQIPASNSENNISSLLNLSSSSSSLSSMSISSLGNSLDPLESPSGGFFNPAFNENQPDRKTEDLQSLSSEDLVFESEFAELANRPKASVLKRSKPVERCRTPTTQTPEPTSPQRSASVKPAPARPPPPMVKKKVVETKSAPVEKRLENLDLNTAMLESSGEASFSERGSIILPVSPFYNPSQDLLGLDQSLFHEIGSSLSEDSKSSFSKVFQGDESSKNPFSAAPESNTGMSTTNPFRKESGSGNLTTLSTPEHKMDMIFDDMSPDQSIHRSSVLTHSELIKGASSISPSNDPFASCFEDAKKELELSNKSESVEGERNVTLI